MLSTLSRRVLVLALALLAAWPVMAQDAGESPQLSWFEPIACVQDAEGTPVRVQCDEATRVCLVARDEQPGGSALDRTQACSSYGGSEAYLEYVAQGYEMRGARAEAPAGWMRDERGRVYQISFDLLNRFYLGASWRPSLAHEGEGWTLDRTTLEAGFEASVHDPLSRSRHDFRVIEGSINIDDLASHGLLFAYDYNVRRQVPLLWITTFIGTPRRYDVMLDVGWGVRLIELEVEPQRIEGLRDLEVLELHLGWNMLQSEDLYSHIRVEAGGGVGAVWDEQLSTEGSWYLSQTARLKGRLGLGERGLHYLTGHVRWEMPYFVSGGLDGRLSYALGAEVAYEVIPLAIVDQPVSLRLVGRTDYREDPSSQTGQWETSALLGARFSLWAPPRVPYVSMEEALKLKEGH